MWGIVDGERRVSKSEGKVEHECASRVLISLPTKQRRVHQQQIPPQLFRRLA